MNLPSIQSYDDINGSEALEILHTRFYGFLHTLPELQERFALTRVVMRLEISLDIWGASPPKKIYHDKLEIQITEPLPPGWQEAQSTHSHEAIIDSRQNPPDQVREEHSLPLPRGIRGQSGAFETQLQESSEEAKYPKPPIPVPAALLPANQPNPNARQLGRRRYAAFVEQDYGSVQAGERTGSEGPVIGGEKVSEIGSAGSGGDHAPPQADFRVADYRNLSPDKARSIVSQTIERGLDIDRAIRDSRVSEEIEQMMDEETGANSDSDVGLEAQALKPPMSPASPSLAPKPVIVPRTPKPPIRRPK